MQAFDSIVSHYEEKPKKKTTRKSSISSYMKIIVKHTLLNIIIFKLQSLKKPHLSLDSF